jgi:hypothetical protein
VSIVALEYNSADIARRSCIRLVDAYDSNQETLREEAEPGAACEFSIVQNARIETVVLPGRANILASSDAPLTSSEGLGKQYSYR